jgi:hypothetical protein
MPSPLSDANAYCCVIRLFVKGPCKELEPNLSFLDATHTCQSWTLKHISVKYRSGQMYLWKIAFSSCCKFSVVHLVTSGGYPALLGSKTFSIPAPVPAPVTVSRPRLFSRFFCDSRLKNQIFKMRVF